LKERNLLGTSLGTTAIPCAAIDDVSAWLLLALLTAMVHSAQSWHRLAITLLLLIAFVAILLLPVRRAALFLETLYRKRGAGVELIAILMLIMLAASWTTKRLGVHALFGAFMAGLVMPKHEPMIAELVERIESLSLALLLPLFFALTGLRTRIDLLTGRFLWGSHRRDCPDGRPRQVGGSRPRCKNHRDDMEGFARPGRPDEHARPGRTGDPERWAGPGYPLAYFVHHDGSHGVDYDLYGHSDPDRHETSTVARTIVSSYLKRIRRADQAHALSRCSFPTGWRVEGVTSQT